MRLYTLGHLEWLRLERWLSGLKRRFAKPLYRVNWYRGFESPPLRQIYKHTDK